jgi:hypothetical protein
MQQLDAERSSILQQIRAVCTLIHTIKRRVANSGLPDIPAIISRETSGPRFTNETFKQSEFRASQFKLRAPASRHVPRMSMVANFVACPRLFVFAVVLETQSPPY